MLAITTLNQNHHEQQVFASSTIALGTSIASDCGLSIEDSLVSARQCDLVWERQQGQIQVTLKNRGETIALDHGPRIHTGVEVQLEAPFQFWVGNTAVQVTDAQARPPYDDCLTSKSLLDHFDLASLQQSPAPATLASWFDALGQLQRCKPGSRDFFERAARACFCPGGLDGAIVVQQVEGEWEIAASHICYPEHGFGFREELVNQAVEQHAVIFHDSQKMDKADFDSGHSTIVCPIFDANGNGVAALYGFRSLNRRNNRQGIRPLEACFVELTAQSISTAMARLESDAEAAKARVLLEQAFSPQVAQKLQQNPQILEGQTCEVTVMFCDLRGFTQLSQRIGAKTTYLFLTDVMDCFSEIISQHHGVVIDFYGDGLSAFWNAPIAMADHAELAAACALKIQDAIEDIESKWRPRLLEEIRVGIGIHTGLAQVGNSGSRTRLKYGPRGNTVNLASRLENATAQSGAKILISQETLNRLPEHFVARKVCRAKLPGIEGELALFELLSDAMSKRLSRTIRKYESALRNYESRQFPESVALLSEILVENQEDRVSEFLFRQCQSHMNHWEGENVESTKADLYPLVDLDSAPESESPRKNAKEKIPDECPSEN